MNKFYKRFPKLKNTFFLVFIGRFHQVKGCDIIIDCIKNLKEKNINLKILFIGKKNKYKIKLQKIAKKYDLEKNIFWSNALYKDLKWGSILASKGMVLCSHGENFGVSIAESLSCSRPVLISNKVNIYNDILDYKSGLVSNDNSDDFTKILNQFYNLTFKQRNQMNINALKCFNNKFNIKYLKNGLGDLLKKSKNE